MRDCLPCCAWGCRSQTSEPGLAVKPEPTARLPSRGGVIEGDEVPGRKPGLVAKGVPSGLRL